MDKRVFIAAKLAEYDVKVSDNELDELLPAYEHLLRWQKVIEAMLLWEDIGEGMVKPASEPALIYRVEKEG